MKTTSEMPTLTKMAPKMADKAAKAGAVKSIKVKFDTKKGKKNGNA